MQHSNGKQHQLIFLSISAYALVVTALYTHRVIAGRGGISEQGTQQQSKNKVTVDQPSEIAGGDLNVIPKRNLFGPLNEEPATRPQRSAPPQSVATVTVAPPPRVVAAEQRRPLLTSTGDRITVSGFVRLNGVPHALMKNITTGENRYVAVGKSAWGYRVQGFDGESVLLEKDGREFHVPLGTSPMETPSGRVREYDFATLTSSTGIRAMGGMVANGVYNFDAGQGLQLSESGVTDNYTIELTFKFDQTDGYRKIVDFKNLSVDDGLYVHNGQLKFYGAEGGGGTLEPGREYQVRLERDQDTQTVRAYLNGEMVLEFNDVNNKAIFDDGNAHFFVDDRSGSEQSSGTARRIRIWDSREAKQKGK